MKKGITLTILTATVVIMFILIGVASAVGISSIKTAAYEEFTSKISRVSDLVNEYYLQNGELPITSEIVSKEGLSTSLIAEITNNGDTLNNLFVIDMRKINVESVNIGSGSVNDLDVFLVAEKSHNVYYLKGVSYKGTTYHQASILNNYNMWIQNGLTVTKGNKTLEVGDLIQYNAGVSGYTGGWKVLGAENGKLLIMSTTDVSSLELYGLEGNGTSTNYGLLNGISRLNEICSAYGRGTGALGARCIKIEDVDKLTQYNPATYGENETYQFGNKVTFSWNGTTSGNVDYTSTNGQNGTLSQSHSSGFSYVDFKTMTKIKVEVDASGMPTLISDSYSYSVNNTTIPSNTKIKEMLFGTNNDLNYWLASPYVDPHASDVRFGLRVIYSGTVYYNYLFISYGNEYSSTKTVRAVVELSPNITVGEKDTTLGWGYEVNEQNVTFNQEEYVQLEYIESSGTQYIDTGIIPYTDFDKVEITFSINSISSNADKVFFGTKGSNNNSNLMIRASSLNSVFAFGYTRPGSGGSTTGSSVSAAANTKYDIKLVMVSNKQTLYLDGTSIVNVNYTTYPSAQTAYLFATHSDNGSVFNPVGGIKLYSCNLYKNNKLVRNFIPYYRKSDNTAGLYDTVNNVFYTNIGTGAFGRGPAV